jgi:dimeric dUTPase (all-alpha-NTP-PPase superfamily)
MSKILNMLQLQQKLNDETNGIGWEEGKTKQGKIINWKRAVFLEAAELIESYPWKHWKNIEAKPNYENIKVELVDIWHFVMSEALRVNYKNGKTIDELAKNIESLIKNLNTKMPTNYYEEIEAIEDFIKKLLCSFELNSFIISFFELCQKLRLDFDNLYKLYIGKNILNKFRQDNGYKEGTYKKIWNGKEDNEVMQELLERNSQITPQELYEELKKLYAQLK